MSPRRWQLDGGLDEGEHIDGAATYRMLVYSPSAGDGFVAFSASSDLLLQRLWNRLPANLRQMTSRGQLSRHLKARLFRA